MREKTELAVALNRTVIDYFAPASDVSINELIVGCGALLAAYIASLPTDLRKKKIQEATDIIRATIDEAPPIDMPSAGGITGDDVRAQSRRNIRVDLMVKAAHLPDQEREELADMLLDVMPQFEAHIHQCRIDDRSAQGLRANGTVLLASMLSTLVNNTTPDKAARQSVRRRLHKTILEHIEGKP